MSKINQIQNALSALDGGAFQKLADSYLKKRGYDYLVPLGSVIGANKVKKGTPDTLAILPNGKYVFAEYTTQQIGLFAKLTGDIRKCFDEVKTGVPVAKIQEIIFCHTSTLSTSEFSSLREICEAHGVNLNVFDIGSISYDLLEKYPGLAKDYLGVDVDTGQIISPGEFVTLYGKNKLATRLNTAFHFREDDLQKIGTALDNYNLVIISGRAGVGKTRVALECCERFNKLHPEYQTLCIFNRGPDLFEDLRIHFGGPGSFLILVDDANRMSKFEYIVQLLQHQRQDQRIKVIVTVRDYAIEKIRDASRTYGEVEEVNIPQLIEEQIKQLIEKEYGIRNHLYLDRISNIAQGNPRLAIMAAEVAKEKNTLDSIDDVSCLYDRYFASIRQDLDELGNTNLLKVAGIVAFFRILDRTNDKIMSAIEGAFGITPEAMWESVNRLHNMEILDIYEDEATRVSDQVLATYLFYLAFFKQPVLDFGKLLEAFFPRNRQRLIDAINPVMSAFDNKALMDVIRPHVDQFWDKQVHEENGECLLQIIDVFWFLKQTDTLIYISDQIAAMPIAQVDLASLDFEAKSEASTPSILSILSAFQQADDNTFRMALNILCDYLEKCPDELPKVLNIFIECFSFRHTSYRHGYYVQQAVVDVLWDRTQQGESWLFSKIFLAVTNKYLRTKCRCTEGKGSRAINIINFKLSPSIELTKLRKSIWDGLLHLYKVKSFEGEVLEELQHYSTSGHAISVSEIFAQDAVEIIPFLVRELSPLNFKHSLLVQTYLDNLERCNVPFDHALKRKFESGAYGLYELLGSDWSEKRTLNLDYEEYRAYKKSEIEKHTSHYNLEYYKQFLEQCAEIKAAIAGSHREHQFQENIIVAFVTLAERDAKLYSEVMNYYLEIQNPLGINPHSLVKSLIEVCSAEIAYSILTGAIYPNQRAWLFRFYSFLPQDQISPERLNQLYNLYQTCESRELPYDLDFLLNYRSIEPEIISRITEILLAKAENDTDYGHSLHALFNPNTKVNEDITVHFSGKTELLKRAYFIELNSTQHGDHDGITFNRILDLDINFIVEYIDWMYGKKKWISQHDDHRDYSFIWKRDNYHEIMIRAAERIFEHEKDICYFSYFQAFFGLPRDDQVSQEINPRQVDLLLGLIENRHGDVDFMKFVFSLISNFPKEYRAPLVSKFIEFNNSFDYFEQLSLEPDHHGWTGSAVPMLQGRVKYLQTLIPLFDTVSLLKHKQHVEKIIKSIRAEIEREKKKDFMDD